MTNPPLHLNDRAARVADQMAARADELAIGVHRVGGARVLDAGVKVIGGIGAGLMLARACTADLVEVSVVPGAVGNTALPAIAVHTSRPVAACMASQYAGWQISVGKYFAMGSGPMRAAAKTEDIFGDIGHVETPRCALGVLETAGLPDEKVVTMIAEACGVEPEHLTLLAARTASIAGGVQIVARSIETAMHKLHALKFDLKRVVGGFGAAPLPPVAADDVSAIGRTNDAVLYGAQVTLLVRGDDDSLEAAGRQLPSSASKDYGEPFAAIFRQVDHDFYKIDPMLFSPASVSLQNIESGRSHQFGETNHQVLVQSFFGE